MTSATNSATQLRYSVLFPVSNAPETIADVCARAVADLPAGYELLICYENDDERTAPALKALAPSQKPTNVRLIKNTLGASGIPNLLKAGVQEAKAPIIVLASPDASDDFTKVDEMVRRCQEGADLVCANRHGRGAQEQGGSRMMLARATGWLFNFFTALPAHDPANFFKAARKESLEKIKFESVDADALGTELTIKVHFGGGRVEEVTAGKLYRAGAQPSESGQGAKPLLGWFFKALRYRLIGTTVEDAAWTGVSALIFLFAVCLYVPWVKLFPAAELDASWYMVMPWAWKHGLDFGREMVFTYGPWGFLLQGYEPTTFRYSVWAWVLFTLLFFIAAAGLSNKLTRRRWAAALWLLFVICVAGTSPQGMHDTRIFLMTWSLVVIHFYVDDRPVTPIKLALVLAMALVGLGKFSMGLTAFLAVGVVSVDVTLRRKIPWLLPIYLLATVLFWLAAGQRLSSLGPFISTSLHISAAYGQGVGISAPTEMRDVTLFAVVGSLILLVMGIVHLAWIIDARAKDARVPQTFEGKASHRNELGAIARAALSLAALAAALMFNFKVGFVRHDGHEVLGTTCMAVLALMYGAAIWQSFRQWAMKALIGLMAVVSVSYASYSLAHWYSDKGYVLGLPSYIFEEFLFGPQGAPGGLERAKRMAGWFLGPWTQQTMTRELNESLDRARQVRQLPPVNGTVDVMSYSQQTLLANGLSYHPRPVYQSYLTYTSDLAQLNADFLRSDKAPDSLFFEMLPIDNHYPSMEESRAWLEILGRYQLTSAQASLHLYERVKAGRPGYTRTPIQPSVTSLLDRWINVPRSVFQPAATTQSAAAPPQPLDMIWAQIDLKPKMPGSLVATIYKPPPVALRIRTLGGRGVEYRLLPDVARGGFLLSPLVADQMGFAFLGAANWRELLHDDAVVQILVSGGEDADFGAFYEPEFTATFSQLVFPQRDLAAVPGIDDFLQFRGILRELKIMEATGQPQLLAMGGALPVLAVPGKTRILLPNRPQAKQLRVRFGVFPLGGVPFATDAVDFRVYALNSNPPATNPASTNPATTEPAASAITGTPIWRQILNPAENAADRGIREATVVIPDPRPMGIMIETEMLTNKNTTVPFWSGIQLK